MALGRTSARRIVLDGTAHRWRLRRRSTYFQGLFCTPCTFAAEHEGTSGQHSWSSPTSRSRATGSNARPSQSCHPTLPKPSNALARGLDVDSSEAPPSNSTCLMASLPRSGQSREGEHRFRSAIQGV